MPARYRLFTAGSNGSGAVLRSRRSGSRSASGASRPDPRLTYAVLLGVRTVHFIQSAPANWHDSHGLVLMTVGEAGRLVEEQRDQPPMSIFRMRLEVRERLGGGAARDASLRSRPTPDGDGPEMASG
jgi:hypothetical protein